MKIGIVSNLYPPQARGGAELVAQRVADALYECGHDVFVLTTQPFGGVCSFSPRIHVRHLGSVYRFFPLNLYYIKSDGKIPFSIRLIWHVLDLFNPLARFAVKNVIQKEEPDVMITHNLKGLGVSVGKEIQRLGVPHVHVIHDVQLSIPSGLLMYGQEHNWLNRSFLRRFYERAVKSSLGTPDLVIFPSSFLASFYKDRGFFADSRLEILPNPLPVIKDEPRLKRMAVRTRFLFVGQLESHKGLLLLLDAMEELDDEVELHIAGDGSLAEYLSERAKRDNRVQFHGFVSLEHLVSTLQTTDAVIVPSLCYENSPTVIYEAFQVGVPVIASEVGGIPELITEGETGILIEPNNKEALLNALKRLHSERDQWWEKTKMIREQAEKYSIKTYVKKLETFFKEIQ
jgi:glycosyltransferase involved in cell wall biosynthesis